jgi:glycosyltransferase involved in cell wall biosynthesis
MPRFAASTYLNLVPMRLLVTVTLNPNQFRAHLEPITALEEVETVTLVADEPGPSMPKVRTIVPPRWLSRTCGRAVAKLITGMVVAVRERPDWVLGYMLVPHGINAVLIAKLVGARSYLHALGGPVEWQGGGYASDNKILNRRTKPSKYIERVLVTALKAADVVAVMGTRAREELIALGLDPKRVVVMPASVDPVRVKTAEANKRPESYDVVTACQLISRKRLHEFLQALAIVRETHPGLRAAIAGRGPLDAKLKEEARRLGLEDAVDFLGFVHDVESVYAHARVFVLTSQREGLSIAMTEAMSAGVPVVVTDIGEARDVVIPGESGFLFEVGDVEGLAVHLNRLLSDDELHAEMSAAAVEAVRSTSNPERITELNRVALLGV